MYVSKATLPHASSGPLLLRPYTAVERRLGSLHLNSGRYHLSHDQALSYWGLEVVHIPRELSLWPT